MIDLKSKHFWKIKEDTNQSWISLFKGAEGLAGQGMAGQGSAGPGR